MYYPLMFDPIYKHMIWGGERLNKLFGRALPFRQVGESWDISCRPNDMGKVKNGRFYGTAFDQLIGINPEGYLGKALVSPGPFHFPLFVKLIDANDDLSVQVHPIQKNEIWYVIHATEGARINAGLVPGVRKEDFAAAIHSGNVEKYLNFISVKAGDVINIAAGTVHALGAYEIVGKTRLLKSFVPA